MPDSLLTAADLSVCDREPITQLERIQPFGFLLAMSTDWTVARASANLEAFIGLTPAAAIGARLDQLVDPSALHEIRNRMAFLYTTKSVERLYGVALVTGGAKMDVAVHFADSMFVLEGELSSDDDPLDAASRVRVMMARLASRTTFDSFHHDAARQIRAMTGFDRVMIYRFHDSGAGEVIAESRSNGTESFLGLHYPASDIPAQARALYLRNPFRVIGDVDAKTVPLLPAALSAVQPLDLSFAITRAVSPVHVEYLKNMRVAASLSISIVVDGALWGLIVCHHGKARLPRFVVRTAAELFGQVYSLTLESWLRRFHNASDQKDREIVDRMVMGVAGNPRLLSNGAWLQDVLRELVACDGIATLVQGKLSVSGMVPSDEDIEVLTHRLNSMPARRIFVTDHLSELHEAAARHAGTAAGMLAIPMSRTPRDYILLFRREWIQEITWAGNPDKSVLRFDDPVRLSPRKSFAVFKESVRGRSRPFTDRERRAAESVRSALVEVILQFSVGAEDDRRKASERQELLIAELNHRVRNILALIRGLISQTQGSGANPSVAEYVRSLSGRVQAIARAHDQITRQNWAPGRLSSLLEEEIRAYVPDRQDRFILEGTDLLLHPAAFSTMSLVAHELVTNSAKYGSLSSDGRVTVTLDRRPGVGLDFKWRESGGPIVKPPQRRGFGSVIIERVVPFDLQGTAEVRYALTGLEVDLFIPDAHLAALPRDPPLDDGGAPSDAVDFDGVVPGIDDPLRGHAVLLLEDNMIVALEAEDLLQQLGAAPVFTASSIVDAEAILESQHVDFALLDINMGSLTSLDFAATINRAGIPFVFASGYGEDVELGALHRAAVTVSKPYSRESLAAAIKERQARGPGPI